MTRTCKLKGCSNPISGSAKREFCCDAHKVAFHRGGENPPPQPKGRSISKPSPKPVIKPAPRGLIADVDFSVPLLKSQKGNPFLAKRGTADVLSDEDVARMKEEGLKMAPKLFKPPKPPPPPAPKAKWWTGPRVWTPCSAKEAFVRLEGVRRYRAWAQAEKLPHLTVTRKEVSDWLLQSGNDPRLADHVFGSPQSGDSPGMTPTQATERTDEPEEDDMP